MEVTIKTKDGELKVSKDILKKNPVFKVMLEANMQETITNTIYLDYGLESVKDLIYYIEKYNLPSDSGTLVTIELNELADKYGLEKLKQATNTRLSHLAYMKYFCMRILQYCHIKEIREIAIQTIRDNLKRHYYSSHIINIFFDYINLNIIPELQPWEAIKIYNISIKYSVESLSEYIEKLLLEYINNSVKDSVVILNWNTSRDIERAAIKKIMENIKDLNKCDRLYDRSKILIFDYIIENNLV